MSVGFSTIKPLNPTTISRVPAYSTGAPATPAASSPMDNDTTAPKKSHWFRNTLITLVAIGAAVGLSRKFLPGMFNPQATLTGTENFFQKGLHYAKKYIGVAGEFVNTWTGKGVQLVKDGWNKLKGLLGGNNASVSGAGTTGATAGATGATAPIAP